LATLLGEEEEEEEGEEEEEHPKQEEQRGRPLPRHVAGDGERVDYFSVTLEKRVFASFGDVLRVPRYKAVRQEGVAVWRTGREGGWFSWGAFRGGLASLL
jgi:hypothetical protein